VSDNALVQGWAMHLTKINVLILFYLHCVLEA
jgi:hypothetical protein